MKRICQNTCEMPLGFAKHFSIGNEAVPDESNRRNTVPFWLARVEGQRRGSLAIAKLWHHACLECLWVSKDTSGFLLSPPSLKLQGSRQLWTFYSPAFSALSIFSWKVGFPSLPWDKQFGCARCGCLGWMSSTQREAHPVHDVALQLGLGWVLNNKGLITL